MGFFGLGDFRNRTPADGEELTAMSQRMPARRVA